jgi:hypothetical protein
MSKANLALTTPPGGRALDRPLGFMFAVIIGAGALALIASFLALVSANAEIQRLLASIPGSSHAAEAISWSKEIGQAALWGNTIAFVFQMCSAGLIGIFAYLLKRSRRHVGETDETLRECQRKVASLPYFLKGRVIGSVTLSRITNVYNLAAVMAGAPSSKVIASVTPVARELVELATDLLEQLIASNFGIATPERVAIQDSAENAQTRLKSLAGNERLSDGSRKGLNHLIGKLEAFMELLRNNPFAQWYDQDNKDLLDGDQDLGEP